MTDAPDANSDDASEGELADSAWLLADNDHPPEYYIRQWQEGNDEEDEEEDYPFPLAPTARRQAYEHQYQMYTSPSFQLNESL